jgi:hypothetical protein
MPLKEVALVPDWQTHELGAFSFSGTGVVGGRLYREGKSARGSVVAVHSSLCQARSQEKLDCNLNMSVAAVNVLRLLAQKAECSPRPYRREAYNRLLVGRLLKTFGTRPQRRVRPNGLTRTIGDPHRAYNRLRSISDF